TLSSRPCACGSSKSPHASSRPPPASGSPSLPPVPTPPCSGSSPPPSGPPRHSQCGRAAERPSPSIKPASLSIPRDEIDAAEALGLLKRPLPPTIDLPQEQHRHE